jgi:hypothetical protein
LLNINKNCREKAIRQSHFLADDRKVYRAKGGLSQRLGQPWEGKPTPG